ncbi:MAG: WbqC family protein [Bacteroidaceae bacterium]
MSNTICLTSAYLAPIHYYARLFACEKVMIEQHDHYVKQTYRNRCEIASANGRLSLTIPVERSDGAKTPMRDVRISDHDHWRHTHWNALVSNYEKSPYFEYYADDLHPFYEQKYAFLLDFNEALQTKVCELLDLPLSMERTAEYFTAEDLLQVEDLREVIRPKTPFTEDVRFLPKPYYQVFSHRYGFLPNMSIVDLLFNMGPEGLLTLRDSFLSL